MADDILIVDDLSINRTILRAKLHGACYSTRMAHDGASALAEAFDNPPGLILLDYHLPDMKGDDICTILRADPRTCDVPIILISSSPDRQNRLRALNAGADDFIPKPVDEALLVARVRNLLRAHARHSDLACARGHGGRQALGRKDADYAFPARIRILGPSRSTGGYWLDRISGLFPGHDCRAISYADLMSQPETSEQPDLCIITPELVDRQGMRVISGLRSHGITRDAAVVMIMPRLDQSIAAMAFDLGACDLLSGKFDAEEAQQRLRLVLQRKRLLDCGRAALERELNLANIDPLTGLHNRRYIERRLAGMDMDIATKSEQSSYAVVLLDLDHFKKINDTFGHQAGDDVLTEVARRFRATFNRPIDLLARFGGEEFIAVLPDTNLQEARERAKAACDSLKRRPITLANLRSSVTITASAGVAIRQCAAGANPKLTLARAIDDSDRALRASKQAGRNIVTVASEAAADSAPGAQAHEQRDTSIQSAH